MRLKGRSKAILPVLLAGSWLLVPFAPAAQAATRTSCPGNPVTVSVSTMQLAGGVQGLLDACPTGTTFNLPAGTFPMFRTLYPKDGDTINGAGSGTGGTILLGSKTISNSNFVKNGSGDWVDSADVVFDLRSLAQSDDAKRKNCAPSYYPQPKPNAGLCSYPDMLYMDGAWLVRTLSSSPTAPCPGPIGAGRYCINYDTKKIYLGSDPNGHTMSWNGVDNGTGHLLTNAITASGPSDGTIINVTVKNLAVSRYANTNVSGGALGMGDGWTVTNVISSYNHGCGISIGGKTTSMPKLVSYSTFTYNGMAGFCGQNNATTFDHNTVTYNNKDYFDVPFGGGGGKFSAGGPITVTNSVFSYNNGNGLSFDVGEQNMTVTNNTFNYNVDFDGGGHGLHFEVSCYGTATGNTAIGNQRMGIEVLESHDITVTGNTVGPNTTAEIQVGTSNRGGSNSCGPQNKATNDLVQNNTITMSIEGQSGVMNSSCGTCVSGSKFTGNTYKTSGNCSAELWRWYTGSAEVKPVWSTWKGTYGQDTSGTCS